MAAILLFAGAVSGCFMMPVVGGITYAVEDPDLSEEQKALLKRETAPYLKGGRGQIDGRVVVQTSSGQEITASAGDQVILTPVTTYSTEQVQEYVIGENKMPPREKTVQFWRMTRANAQGRFKFTQLAPGQYYVLCPLVIASGEGSASPLELIALAKVGIAGNETVPVLVTTITDSL